MDRISLGRTRSSKRTSTACEHCRVAKAKCQPSEQPGVCGKCLASRRECISRTKPRPHRYRRTLRTGEAEPSPPTPSQPSTFSIDYSVPARVHLEDGFETLRDLHSTALDNVLNEAEPSAADELQTVSQSASPSSLSTQSRSNTDIWRKPQFNMASAECLLNSFDSMLEYLPFLVLPAGSTVPDVAATKPFVLLAILTVASGSRSVQKHSLYDDEFLKVLGLKYVSGGERSLQLLQGLLIYCTWYPFHLSPRNSQLAHCIRMAADIVHDLCLDENFLTSDPKEQEVTDEELDKIRAYLAYVYLVSTYIVIWKGDKCLRTRLPSWASTAIDVLEQNAQVDGDYTLVALVRLSILCSDASDAIKEREKQAVRNSQLILMGLEQQYQQVRDSILAASPTVFDHEPVKLQTMFLDIYLDAGSLLALPVAKTPSCPKTPRFPPPASKICSATKKLRAFLDYVGELGDTSLLSFTVNDWTLLIVVLTLSFRLSFPLSLCPDFDWAWANSEIQLGGFLSKVSRDADAATAASRGILAANRAVLGVLKSKYKQRLSSLGESPASQESRTYGCPVLGGGLGQATAHWNPGLTEASEEQSPDSEMSEIFSMSHEVWASATEGWQDVDGVSWGLFEDLLNDNVVPECSWSS